MNPIEPVSRNLVDNGRRCYEPLDLIEANPEAVKDSTSAVLRELIERAIAVKARP